MSIGFSAAAKGAPEMAFWPTAVSVIMFAESPDLRSLLLMVLLVFVGSMTYLAIREMKAFMKIIRKEHNVRRNTFRSRDLAKRSFQSTMAESAREVLPENKYSFSVVMVSILGDFLAGGIFLFSLIKQITHSPEPKVTAIGLVALPFMYGFVILSIIIWKL